MQLLTQCLDTKKKAVVVGEHRVPGHPTPERNKPRTVDRHPKITNQGDIDATQAQARKDTRAVDVEIGLAVTEAVPRASTMRHEDPKMIQGRAVTDTVMTGVGMIN